MCNTREETSPADTVLISLDVVTRDNIYQHIFATMSFSSASLQFGYFCKKIQITMMHWRKTLLSKNITGEQNTLHQPHSCSTHQHKSAFLI